MNARELQEPVLRWLCSATFAGCAVAFCTTVGDVEASTSVGLIFGLLFAAAPAGWLWGRELQEIQVRNDRRDLSAQSSGRLQLRDEDDEDDDPVPPRTRPLRVADDDD